MSSADCAAPLWYFAYGSNMTLDIFRGRRALEPLETTWGWLAGYRLCFDIPVGPGERGVANLEADASARTCGVLYLLDPESAERLDRTEGVHNGVYHRLPVTVTTAPGDPVVAFAYHSARRRPGRKPSPRYMGLLLAGAREHGLPSDYVDYLCALPLARDERPEYAEGAAPKPAR